MLGTLDVVGNTYAVHEWEGTRGLLDTRLAFVEGSRQLFVNGFRIRVMGMRLDDPGSPAILVGTTKTPCEGGYDVVHRFESCFGPFELVGRLQRLDNSLRIGFHLQQTPAPQPWFVPRIEEFALDRFDQLPERIYAGPGNVIRRPAAFDLAFDGHRLSFARRV